MNQRTVALMSGACLGLAMLLTSAASAQDAPPRLDPAYPNYQPRYPDAAQVNGEQGNVVLKVQVGTSGRVRSVQVIQSSGYPDLDNAAVAGVFGWRYIPAQHDGDTATDWTTVTISYRPPALMIAPAPKT